MPKKIFELAKELEVNSLGLVEKIKGYGFSVRNHMSSLTDEIFSQTKFIRELVLNYNFLYQEKIYLEHLRKDGIPHHDISDFSPKYNSWDFVEELNCQVCDERFREEQLRI